MQYVVRRAFSSKPPAATVKALREATGAGVMDCFKALQENDNDLNKAVEQLKKRNRLVGRENSVALEGCIALLVNEQGSMGVIAEINCETDFVAKGETFATLCDSVITKAYENRDSLEIEKLQQACAADVLEVVNKIGEKVEVRRVQKVDAPMVGGYLHGAGNMPRIGALVGLDYSGGEDKKDRAQYVSQRLAIQVAGMETGNGVDEILGEDFDALPESSGTIAEVLKKESLALLESVRYERGAGLVDTRQEDFVAEIAATLKDKQ